MRIVPYALMAYGLTIIISLLVIAIVVLTNKIMNRPKKEDKQDE